MVIYILYKLYKSKWIWKWRVIHKYNTFPPLQKANNESSAKKHLPSNLFPINWNTFVKIFQVSIHLHSLSYQIYYSHADTVFGLGVGSLTGAKLEALMKVWLMVLTTIPYSSISARRQSKKAWTACLDAASDRHRHTQTHTFILCTQVPKKVCPSNKGVSFHSLQGTYLA